MPSRLAPSKRYSIVELIVIGAKSLSDLLGTIQHLEACGEDLYLDQQAIDTAKPMGKLVFQLTGAFD